MAKDPDLALGWSPYRGSWVGMEDRANWEIPAYRTKSARFTPRFISHTIKTVPSYT
jgi:hypothetical protein